MSSYHTNFTYKDLNSHTDKSLIVVAFDPDNGFTETFLSMEPIYTDSAFGTQRIDYGAKYNSVATFTITVIKEDCTEFTVAENRDILKWLTGSRKNSWLDLYVGDRIDYSFFGRVTNVQQRKLDSKVIGLKIEFTSIHPWAWSQPKSFDCNIGQGAVLVGSDGVIYREDVDEPYYIIDDDGVIYTGTEQLPVSLSIDNNGWSYSDEKIEFNEDNLSDDLYTYTNLDILYENLVGATSNARSLTNASSWVEIRISNEDGSFNETTRIDSISDKEIISLSANQFIISDIPNKIFGDTFNFVWPRLAPGKNNIVIEGAGKARVTFTYRHPMKVGDCAININEIIDEIGECYIVDYDELMEMLEAVLE